jgi:uncharacterized protein YkwD
LAVLALVAVSAGVSLAEAEFEPCADTGALQQAVEQLNALRLQAGAPCAGALDGARPLTWEARLASSAWEQATDLALHDRLSHVDARQRGLGARLRSVGYAAASAGENLAAGQNDFGDTLAAWLDSPRHCANLMAREYRDVGLACVQRRGTRYERFWVAHLGAPVRP